MSTEDDDRAYPRSMLHKQILDKAKANPDASMKELASMVPSATTELVERTLDEYGDPGTTAESGTPDGGEANASTAEDGKLGSTGGTGSSVSTASGDTDEGDGADETDAADAESGLEDGADGGDDTTDDADGATGETDQQVPDPQDISEKQRAVLEIIAADPSATQREIGEELGVSSATINNRVNSIDGFEWEDRKAFVSAMFEQDVPADEGAGEEDMTIPEEVVSTLSDIECHLAVLDERLDDLEDREGTPDPAPSGLDDPELVHKVLHACLESDRLSEQEELRLLKSVLS